MTERFPDIDWWCDGCGAYLNDQDGFDLSQISLEMYQMWI